MDHHRRSTQVRTLVAIAAAFMATMILSGGPSAQGYAPQGISDDDRTIVHILNRLGYGPRPGDIERVRETGVEAYLEEQRHPRRIAMTLR